ncbi:hypothetical protein [Sulfuritalea hydrogenivorans]|uniref:Uncharacterized protein n=1 Tax=Sulfuritalea hydrogenivorans sk43H TaxID=1223802 RepID=W0SIH0_9PROT|nr:hypothetical protein [Sulfuritalea hydrogenivorans]BAO30647.1 hypothetical protein SUTH_02868 [Sulfuritalea hydrogenivorans sk43H]
MSGSRRSPLPRRAGESGFVLIALIALLAMGGLYFFISNLSPELMRARHQQTTNEALTQAREALIGYAVRFREDQLKTGTAGQVYGYLPLPDLGSSRNQNATDVDCYLKEGCEAYNFAGNGSNVTVIGRFPWRTLGTGPLRDSHGECLWYAVSGSHQRIQQASPMNWDTLSQMDVVVANGTAAMISAVASAHDRPIAVIFSPGPPLTGQDRSASTTDSVTECGGNYVVGNYLDPVVATNLGGITNYLAGSTNNASGDTSAANKSLSAGGIINRRSDGALWAGNCASNDPLPCTLVANDAGATVTSELLFRTLRGSSYFRTDINAMLDRMATCLRDQVAAGTGFTPDALSGFTAPADKTVGRIPSSTCYDDAQNPLGYFSHYRDQVFVASKIASDFTATVDGVAQTCPAVVMFAGQRGSGQARGTSAERNAPANYLEGTNLTGFITTGALNFSGPSLLAQVSSSQSASQDIVRCIPSGANLTTVESPNLSAAQQLVAYDAATGTLTLGKENVTNFTADSAALFGCAWIADEKTLGSGLRSYFQFSFATLGTSVGNTGFVFALIDTESNTSLPCGSAGSHLGYSGNNSFTPKLRSPKVGIEFDQSRNSGFPGFSGETSTAVGRNDPCYLSSCGAIPAQTASSHSAIVYWGHEAANATDVVTLPDGDDNVHGFPTAGSIATVRRPPRNPDTPPGIEFVNLRTGGQLFHVRVEITPTRAIDPAAELSKTTLQTKVWILPDSVTVANQITAMKDTTRPMSLLYPTFTETLGDTARVFDVGGSACSSGSCPTNQTCGTDNICYRQGLRKTRLGFTGSQRTQDQEVRISNMFTTWLP